MQVICAADFQVPVETVGLRGGLGPFASPSALTICQTVPLGGARAWGSSLYPSALHSAVLYRVLSGLGGRELLVGSGQGASFSSILGKFGASRSNPGYSQPWMLILRVFWL